MADRVQVNDLPIMPVRPAAAPLDTYYRPTAATFAKADETGGQFADLAQALGVIKPEVTAAAQAELDRQKELAQQQGAEARLKNQKSFKDAVAEGLIPEAANPWFVKGYLQQDGRISGMEYDEAMRTEWSKQGIGESDNPKALSDFMANFRKSWIEQHHGGTPDWMDGFAPQLQKAENNLSAQHIAHVQHRISETLRENTGIEITKMLDGQLEREAGMMPGDPIVEESRKATAAAIQARLDALVKNGLPGRDANKILAEAVINKAIEVGDRSVLKVLDDVQTPGGPVSKIADVKKAINAADTHILSVQRQQKLDAAWDEDRPHAIRAREHADKAIIESEKDWAVKQKSQDREEATLAYESELVMKINAGRGVDPRKLDELAKVNPAAAMRIQAYRHERMMQASEIITDQRAAADMALRIATDPKSISPTDIFGGVNRGKWNLGVAETLYNKWSSGHNDAASKDPDFHTLQGGLLDAISKNPYAAYGSPDASQAATQFRAYFNEVAAMNIPESEKLARIQKKQIELIDHYNKFAAARSQSAVEQGVVKPSGVRGEGQAKTPATLPPASLESIKQIPQASIDALRSNPDMWQEFDKKYGFGAASIIRSNQTLRGLSR